MLTEREMQMLTDYFRGEKTVTEIANDHGYANRSSLYKLLENEEAQDYINKLTDQTMKNALRLLKMNSRDLSKSLLDIAKGNIADVKKVYAQLQAINSALEKAGMNSKTIVFEDKNSNDDDYNELMDMLKEKKTMDQ
ncbi:hypothetical protein [Bacillus norwichensis]|uniref:Homeodomain phBC6A51-type domain-containing protein n=1 Tax=Bacillus norwichensis TaxID=2762217 RepID=A0ABR8VIF8_9BACI|nr:hypothetical protein [Bacillus norwichensis]MBD8004544.1 hypothetical protein [Bacillus norwichensis]